MYSEKAGAVRASALMTPATRTGVMVSGIIGGVISIEHGFFEILQGAAATNGPLINAIGPAQRFWENGTELALTVVPNFLITGICAAIVGLLVIVWSVRFLNGRFAALGFFVLQILQLLLGGGIAFFAVALIMSITATRIGRPLTWWRTRVPLRLRKALGALWPWLFFPTAAGFCLLILAGIFGVWFLDPASTASILTVVGYTILGLMTASAVTGVARDSTSKGETGEG